MKKGNREPRRNCITDARSFGSIIGLRDYVVRRVFEVPVILAESSGGFLVARLSSTAAGSLYYRPGKKIGRRNSQWRGMRKKIERFIAENILNDCSGIFRTPAITVFPIGPRTITTTANESNKSVRHEERTLTDGESKMCHCTKGKWVAGAAWKFIKMKYFWCVYSRREVYSHDECHGGHLWFPIKWNSSFDWIRWLFRNISIL